MNLGAAGYSSVFSFKFHTLNDRSSPQVAQHEQNVIFFSGLKGTQHDKNATLCRE